MAGLSWRGVKVGGEPELATLLPRGASASWDLIPPQIPRPDAADDLPTAEAR
jgi:hypothetical protein